MNKGDWHTDNYTITNRLVWGVMALYCILHQNQNILSLNPYDLLGCNLNLKLVTKMLDHLPVKLLQHDNDWMMSLPPQQCYKAGALTKKNSSWTNCNEKLSNLQQLAFLATFPDTKAKVNLNVRKHRLNMVLVCSNGMVELFENISLIKSHKNHPIDFYFNHCQ